MNRLPARALALVIMAATLADLPAQDLAHREQLLTVTVRDASGALLPATDVRIETIDPEFRWGTAVTAARLRDEHPETMRALNRYFNSITFENDMKWSSYANSTVATREAYRQAVEGMSAFGGTQPLRIRGHVTLWANQAPYNFNTTSLSAEQIRALIDAHIEAYHTEFKGAVTQYDFYNEPRSERALIQKLVPSSNWAEGSATSGVAQAEIDEVAGWFKRAAEVDPEAVLYINDYNIINNWEPDHRRVRAYKDYIDRLRDAGAPVGGIGVQCHIDRYVSHAQVKDRLDILAAPMAPTAQHPEGLPGLPIEVTELDINNPANWYGGTYPSADVQAEIIDNVVRAAFEHPAVVGLTIWGINDGYHWRDNSVLYDASGALKPSGQAFVDLVRGAYWTSEEGQTDASGQFARTVFRGTLRISARVDGLARSVEVSVGKTAATLELTLEEPVGAIETYGDWLDRHWFTSVDDFGQYADLDGDRINNFIEYLTGSDPAVAGYRPAAGELSASGAEFLVQIPIRTHWTQRLGLVPWAASASAGPLQAWVPAAGSPQSQGTSGDFEVFELRLPSDAAAARFYTFTFPRDRALTD
ncbi:MAG: endo-1,4-beta-xylanase [Opitutales bacterium]